MLVVAQNRTAMGTIGPDAACDVTAADRQLPTEAAITGRRDSLGIWYRFSMGNAWQKFAEMHQPDERVSGPVTRTADFGIFVGLEGGIEGLVHLGDISWSEPGKVAIKRFARGDVVEVVILSIDVELQRVSLGIKQVDNPMRAFADRYPVGADVVGRVAEVYPQKLVVDLPGGFSGTVYQRNPRSKGTRFEIGNEVDLVVRAVWLRHGVIELGFKDFDDESSSGVVVEPNNPPSPKPLTNSRNVNEEVE
ncbi:MAG: S1 RNA-binding domain-containing protein [Pseudomonadales bacterium]